MYAANCNAVRTTPRRVYIIQLNFEWECKEIVVGAIEELSDEERVLILEIFWDGLTPLSFCKEHGITRKRFLELEGNALAVMRQWLATKKVRQLSDAI